MSDSQQYEKVSVSSDGVTVDKRFEEDEFPVPAIAFEITSNRSETVTVTLTDQVPEDVAVEDLGFHPEYGSEYWTIEESEITFERELEANSEYTTVYGIRATGTDDVEKFLTEPVIEKVDPPLDEADVVDEQGSDVVRDVISGDSDAVPGLDDDDGDDSGTDDVGTLDLKDPNAPDDDSGGNSADEAALEEAGVDSLVGALADEIRSGNVDANDVKLLGKAVEAVSEDGSSGGGGDGGDGGAVDARIQRLQTEVSDLMAYTDALEQFLNENGTGEDLIEEFRQDVQSFESDLQEVRDLASGHEQALSEIESSVDEVETSMNDLQSEMSEVVADVDGVRDDVQGVESTVENVETTVDEVESTVDAVESDLEELEGQVGDIDVEGVRGDIQEIEEEIEELKEWREQLSSVIGGS